MLDANPAPDALARPPLPATAIDPPASPALPSAGDALFAAAQALLPVLEAGRPLDATTLRDAMTEAFGRLGRRGRLGLEGRLRSRRSDRGDLHAALRPGHAP